MIHGLIGKDYLLLTDVPTCLSINESTYILQYSDCISGDLHMSEARECYLPLKLALTSLKTYYPACLLTIKSNAVAVFYGNNGSFKYFDSHSRDVYGNVNGNGTSVLLEFDDLDALVGYLQDIYSINVDPIVPFEIRGVNVPKLQHHQHGNSNVRKQLSMMMIWCLHQSKIFLKCKERELVIYWAHMSPLQSRELYSQTCCQAFQTYIKKKM